MKKASQPSMTKATTTSTIRTTTATRNNNRQRRQEAMAAATAAANDAKDMTIMQAAMRQLPLELTSAYHEARLRVPHLVAKESNPQWFLSFHQSDPLAAARRLANYWKQRKEIFKERAFLPINLSGNGALTPEDISHLRTGFCVNLPCDPQGRSVLYVDVSKHRPDTTPSSRTIFFFLQCVMENETSRHDGFHTLFNISNPFAANYSPSAAKCSQMLMDHCIPIKFQRLYFVHMPPPGAGITQSFIDTIFTWGINRLVSYMGTTNMISLVVSSKEDCLAKLTQEFHFLPDKLPVGLGGSWTGGCEPWRRKGSTSTSTSSGGGGGGGPDGGGHNYNDDELTLELETDLSCLFRNSLWLHNQVVAQQQQQQHQQSSSLAASETSSSSGQPPPAAVALNNNDNTADDTIMASTNVPLMDRKLPAVMTTTTTNQHIMATNSGTRVNWDPVVVAGQQQHLEEEHKSCTTPVFATAAAAAAAPSRQDDDDDYSDDTMDISTADDDRSEAKASMTAEKEVKKYKMTTTADDTEKQQTEEDEEDKSRKRGMHTINGRKRREKARIELEVLQEQCSRLKTMNQSLESEQSRLVGLVQAANNVVMIESETTTAAV